MAAARVLRVCFELRVVRSNPASQRFKRVSSSEGVESVFEECAWEQGGKRLKRVAHKQLILQQGLVANHP